MKLERQTRIPFPALSLMLLCSLILYMTCAMPVYEWTKKSVMKRLYHDIEDMNLSALDDEDEETMDEYQEEKYDIFIADSSFGIVYCNKRHLPDNYVKKVLTDDLQKYQDRPQIDKRAFETRDVLIMRGKISQKEEQYYIYIKKDIQTAKELVEYTSVYLLVLFLLLIFLNLYLSKRRIGQEIEQTRKNTFQKEVQQKEFVAGIAHELKTPLAILSGQLEMLQIVENEEDQEYYYASMQEEIDKMSKMIGEYLEISTLDNRMENMKTEIVNLSEIAEFLIMRYTSLFEKNSIHLVKEIDGNCICNGNLQYLERAVNSIIMNAFQHTCSGRQIQISLKEVSGKNRIEIYNDGSQIRKQDLKKIWENYYTTGGADTKNIGMGLYQVRRIIEAHGGSYGVLNEKNGVRFWIELDAEKAMGENG